MKISHFTLCRGSSWTGGVDLLFGQVSYIKITEDYILHSKSFYKKYEGYYKNTGTDLLSRSFNFKKDGYYYICE